MQEQSSESLEDIVTSNVSQVLVIYAGGTIGMKNTKNHGYIPVPGYITRVLSNMTRFHDPSGFAFADTQAERISFAKEPQSPTEQNFHFTNTVHIPLSYPEINLENRIPPDCEECVTISGTKCVKAKLPSLISPPSLFGKRTRYSILEYEPLLDSSNMNMSHWVKIATDIEVNYQLFDAFIVLHGTDTMAYTASALSFMLEDLGKTVILTGSQVPLAEVRNDAVENLLGALTIAAHFTIPEVGLFFGNKLYRGNRASKVDAYEFNAFDSPNMRPLVSVGISIDVRWDDVTRPSSTRKFRAHKKMNGLVAALRIFPGISEAAVKAFLQPPIAGVVLETFGSGNAPNNRPEFLQALKEASDRGVVIVNCTQCKRGMVTDLYATGKALLQVGVVPGSDMTPECALTKLSYLLSKDLTVQECRGELRKNLRGELTTKSKRIQFTYQPNTVGNLADLLKDRPFNDLRDNQGLEKMLVPVFLLQSIRYNDLDAFQSLLENYPNFINVGDCDGRTPLHYACAFNQFEIAEKLLLNGSSVHQRDRLGKSPLSDAVKTCNLKLIDLLTSTGAHFGPDESEKVLADAFKSAYLGELGFIRSIDAANLDLNSSWIDGETLLHSAVRGNQVGVTQYLLEKRVALLRNNSGQSPRDIATARNYSDIMRLFLFFTETPAEAE